VTPTIVDPIGDNTLPTQPRMTVPFIEDHQFDKDMTPKTLPKQPQPDPVPEQVPVHD
jgi:hypothetical protein